MKSKLKERKEQQRIASFPFVPLNYTMSFSKQKYHTDWKKNRLFKRDIPSPLLQALNFVRFFSRTCSFTVLPPHSPQAASQQALHSNLSSRKLLQLNSKEFPPTQIQFLDDWLFHHSRDSHTICPNTAERSRNAKTRGTEAERGQIFSGSSVRLKVRQKITSHV